MSDSLGWATHAQLVALFRNHSVRVPCSRRLNDLIEVLNGHRCVGGCTPDLWLFRRPLITAYPLHMCVDIIAQPDEVVTFPPTPRTLADYAEIVRDWTTASSAAVLEEAPCTVCALNVPKQEILPLSLESPPLQLLYSSCYEYLPPTLRADPRQILCKKGIDPVSGFANVCVSCITALDKNKRIPGDASLRSPPPR